MYVPISHTVQASLTITVVLPTELYTKPCYWKFTRRILKTNFTPPLSCLFSPKHLTTLRTSNPPTSPWHIPNLDSKGATSSSKSSCKVMLGLLDFFNFLGALGGEVKVFSVDFFWTYSWRPHVEIWVMRGFLALPTDPNKMNAGWCFFNGGEWNTMEKRVANYVLSMGLGWLQDETQEVVTTSILQRICESFASLSRLDPRNVSSTNAWYLSKFTMPCMTAWQLRNLFSKLQTSKSRNMSSIFRFLVIQTQGPQGVLLPNHRFIFFFHAKQMRGKKQRKPTDNNQSSKQAHSAALWLLL